MSNYAFKDHLRLDLGFDEHTWLTHKEVLYLAERLEADGQSQKASLLKGLVGNNLSKNRRAAAWWCLYHAYRDWASKEDDWSIQGSILYPWIRDDRERMEREEAEHLKELRACMVREYERIYGRAFNPKSGWFFLAAKLSNAVLE